MNKDELKKIYGDEKVFVVPYDHVKMIPDGFTNVKHDRQIWSRFDNVGSFMYRYDVENVSYIQQIIPYVVILNNSGDKIFVTKRISGEPRLINQLSIACGGHINEDDGTKEPLFKAAVRELFEEVNINVNQPFEIFGYVRDLKSTTNDHIGVTIYIRTDDNVSVKEKDKLIGQWMSLDDLINKYSKFESWSKKIIDFFVEKNKIY